MRDVSDAISLCDREPIHIPGSIQPYGVLLVAARDTFAISHVAGDVEARLGVVDWAGADLADAIGPLLGARAADAVVGYIGQMLSVSGETLDVSASYAGDFILVELEPAEAETPPAALVLNRLEAASVAFERTGSLAALCDRAAIEFRHLTGFDRVMVYRFLDDNAGKVVAEARHAAVHSFLHHHFPAGDIPLQARALYLRNLVRVIPDIRYQRAELRPVLPDLDMSDSLLRSVSPIHLDYLRNMGVAASASVSIVKDGALWGLIACHNETPRLLPYHVRAACRALASGLARQIKAKEEAEGYRQRLRLRSMEDEITGLLSRDGTLDQAISSHLDEISRMFAADGVAVLRGQELITGGMCPGVGAVRDLAVWLLARGPENFFVSDSLSASYQAAGDFCELGSGVLAMTLSPDEPWQILWFRAEQIETLKWAGNPHPSSADPADQLTPRASFAAWQETVRGRARAWSPAEIEAAKRLRSDLLEERQHRRLQDLNHSLTNILRDKDQLLQQKEFLIGEVNHRVQNSLQLVSSFLGLQARAADAPLRAALDEACRRIGAVALVHRRLYRGDQIEMVDAARYVEELCAETVSSLGRDWARFLQLDLTPMMISTDRAVTLGLVLTELMINANKYAYGGAAGPLDIRLIEDRGGFKLIVADQGTGRVSPKKGFGSRMIEGLVAQMGGIMEYSDNQPGLCATVTVKKV